MEYHFLDFDYYDIAPDQKVGLHTRLSGNNKKKLLILITKEDAEEDKAMTTLKAILNAIKYDMEEDCALLPIDSKESIVFQKLPLDACHHIISFGISPKQMGLQIQHHNYTTLKILEKELLFADTLSVITNDVSKKKLLWAALQSIFSS